MGIELLGAVRLICEQLGADSSKERTSKRKDKIEQNLRSEISQLRGDITRISNEIMRITTNRKATKREMKNVTELARSLNLVSVNR